MLVNKKGQWLRGQEKKWRKTMDRDTYEMKRPEKITQTVQLPESVELTKGHGLVVDYCDDQYESLGNIIDVILKELNNPSPDNNKIAAAAITEYLKILENKVAYCKKYGCER